MNDYTFSLFMEVINAAKDGRYCHGNGAQWCIVDGHGNHVVINTMTGITTGQTVPNPVEPHVDMETARSLEQYLMKAKADDIQTGVSSNYDHIRYAAQAMLWAVDSNAVCHFNGAQCFIDTGYGVQVQDLSIPGQVTSVVLGRMASWQYLRANGNTRQRINKETLGFLKRYV